MRVSIILPVYNQEEYLEAALSDALGQTYEDVEVVAVDDGSTDSSGLILRRFAAADSRIRVVCKENGGLVSANASGITAATGDYICFLDPDDRIGPDFVSSFVQELDRPYDFIAKGFHIEGKGKSKPFLLREDHIFSLEEIRALSSSFLLTSSLTADDSIYVTRWNKMYRKDVPLRFVDEYAACGSISLCEDVIFAYLLLQYAENGKSCVQPSSYRYFVHENSMSHYFDYERTVNELDATFEVFSQIIARHSREYTSMLLSYYTALLGQLGSAVARGGSPASSIYSALQSNDRFRESVECAARYSKGTLSVGAIKTQLLYHKVPFWVYRFARLLYQLIKR